MEYGTNEFQRGAILEGEGEKCRIIRGNSSAFTRGGRSRWRKPMVYRYTRMNSSGSSRRGVSPILVRAKSRQKRGTTTGNSGGDRFFSVEVGVRGIHGVG